MNGMWTCEPIAVAYPNDGRSWASIWEKFKSLQFSSSTPQPKSQRRTSKLGKTPTSVLGAHPSERTTAKPATSTDGCSTGSSAAQVTKRAPETVPNITIAPKNTRHIVYPLAWSEGLVPFHLDRQNTNWLQQSLVERAIEEIQRYTCIRFVPSPLGSKPILLITNKLSDPRLKALPDNKRCETSKIGYRGPDEVYNVALECGEFGVGAVQHQLMHKLGFDHEERREDRDLYLMFFEENICDKEALAPIKGKLRGYDMMAYAYDPDSVMQGAENTAACPKHRATMKHRHGRVLGRQYSLTALDAMKINDVYHCGHIVAPIPKASGRPSNPCTFDIDWCGYTQFYKLQLYNTLINDTYADDFDWIRSNQSLPERYRIAGPLMRDHTPRDDDGYGYYIMALSERHDRSHVAKIASPWFRSESNGGDGHMCLEFYWYLGDAFFYGLNTTAPPEGILGQIDVFLLLNTKYTRLHTVKPEATAETWNRELIDFQLRSGMKFQIVFQASVAVEGQSDVAIDDVALYGSKCSEELNPNDLIRAK